MFILICESQIICFGWKKTWEAHNGQKPYNAVFWASNVLINYLKVMFCLSSGRAGYKQYEFSKEADRTTKIYGLNY